MATLAQIQAISKRIKPHLNEIPVSNQGRDRISAALSLVADCHFQAIIYLFKRKLFASAFALLRPQMETSLRGAWALHCNDEDAVEAAHQNDEFPKINMILDHLEKSEKFSRRKLSKTLSPPSIRVFHSFTHGGSFQIVNHLKEDAIEPSFSQGVIDKAMTTAAFFGLFTAVNVALLAANEELAEKIAGIFEELE